LGALRAIPGFDGALRSGASRLSGLMGQGQPPTEARLVGPSTEPKLHALWLRVCRYYDVADPWPLYRLPDRVPNAAAMGIDAPVVMVTDGLLDLLPDHRELAAVMAHEVGHLLSDHLLGKLLARTGLGVGLLGLSGPLSPLVTIGAMAGLQEWDRKSELSADRASLLFTGDAEVAIRALQKVSDHLAAHGALPPWEQPTAPAESARDKLRAAATRVGHFALSRHPLTATRIDELRAWQDSGVPALIRAGDYPRRADHPAATFAAPWEEWRATAEQARDAAATHLEPVEAKLRDLQEQAAGGLDRAVAWLRREGPDRE
jgi:Zn-dependent protease with chaperone function